MSAAFKAGLNRIPPGLGGGVFGLGVAGLIAYGVNESIYTVEGGHRAILFSRIGGVQSEVYSEGLHFRVPWFQWPIIYDIRAKPHRITSISGTKDLQMVNVSIRVLSRPTPSELPNIYRNLGTDYDERVLPSIVNEVLKSEMARFNASQLITQRERVSELIRERLTERATEFWIQLDDVSITDLRFGDEYSKAVENKQIAQQEAQRAALLVEQARQARQQKIVEAEGEARAAELIGKAIQKNPGFLSLRRIEAARNIAQTVSNSNNRVFLDSSQLLLNVEEFDFNQDSLKAGSESNAKATQKK